VLKARAGAQGAAEAEIRAVAARDADVAAPPPAEAAEREPGAGGAAGWARFWVAEVPCAGAAVVVGMVALCSVSSPSHPGFEGHAVPVAEIKRFFVARRARRAGVGGRLFACARAAALEAGFVRLFLQTSRRFADARRSALPRAKRLEFRVPRAPTAVRD
jgi:GNAT superfamily N-acetyltransferase